MEDYKKKYKDAFERAKVVNPGTTDYNIVTNIFPELKESEDERIRKAIKLLIEMKENDSIGLEPVYGASYKEMIAWLEKQSEIIDKYEDKLDRCACESFSKGYKAALEKQGEQNPAWSEEDEKKLTEIISEFEAMKYNSSTIFEKNLCDDKITFLKVLKERVSKIEHKTT